MLRNTSSSCFNDCMTNAQVKRLENWKQFNYIQTSDWQYHSKLLLIPKKASNTTESLGEVRQSVQSPAGEAGFCPLICPSPPWDWDLLGTLHSDRDCSIRRSDIPPLISRTCDHLKKTFPFPGYSDPIDLPWHSSFAVGLAEQRADLPPERKLASRRAGRAAQVRQGTGRAEDSTKPGHARLCRAAQSRSQTSIQGNISSSSVW